MSVTVYCHRPDRLGARLRNLIYAMKFSERVEANLILNWSPTAIGLALDAEKASSIDQHNYCFFELFDQNRLRQYLPEMKITHLRNDEMKRVWQLVKDEKSLLISENPNLKYSDYIDKYVSPIFYDSTNPYRFVDDAAEDKTEEIYFNRLPLHPVVQEALSDVSQQLELQQALCLHVRRGDLLNVSDFGHALKKNRDNIALQSKLLNVTKHFINRYAPYEAFKSAISEIGGNSKLLIMSDDEKAKMQFTRDYGKRCLDYKSILDRYQLSTHQRDFIEFLLIARSGKVIGTESAFVYFSAKIGGKKVINALEYINVSSFIEELRRIFEIDRSQSNLLVEILNLYIESFTRRPCLADKNAQLIDYVQNIRSS